MFANLLTIMIVLRKVCFVGLHVADFDSEHFKKEYK